MNKPVMFYPGRSVEAEVPAYYHKIIRRLLLKLKLDLGLQDIPLVPNKDEFERILNSEMDFEGHYSDIHLYHQLVNDRTSISRIQLLLFIQECAP